jgi:hypothetical protein
MSEVSFLDRSRLMRGVWRGWTLAVCVDVFGWLGWLRSSRLVGWDAGTLVDNCPRSSICRRPSADVRRSRATIGPKMVT